MPNTADSRVTDSVRPLSDVPSDPSRRWTRELADLHARVRRLKLSGSAAPRAVVDVIDDSLNMCANLLHELAGAHLVTRGLQDEVKRETARWNYLFDRMSSPCVATDGESRILNANRSAALFLSVSSRHLGDRLLLHFCEDREAFTSLLRTMEHESTRYEAALMIRPKERAPREMSVVVVPEWPGDAGRWLWFFSPIARSA
jgi:PAS domain-containing protein